MKNGWRCGAKRAIAISSATIAALSNMPGCKSGIPNCASGSHTVIRPMSWVETLFMRNHDQHCNGSGVMARAEQTVYTATKSRWTEP